ncbi:MAG: hypothetical protein AB7O96_02215 [Pseudobdellovibrionaceae bacterium]
MKRTMSAKFFAAAGLVLSLGSFLSSNAVAMTLDWSGNYRAEYFQMDSTSLSSPKQGKSYLLHHLSLSPKIVASDGVNVVSRFNIFSTRRAAYANSQVGDEWGGGVDDGTATTGTEDSNTFSQNQNSSGIQVSELYLKVDQEYGSLLVGRVPMQFGLGMTHNAGRGEFDHWYDSRDAVGYKFVVGNLYFMPMLARTFSGTPGDGRTITDQIFNLLYENVETGSTLGIWWETRKASAAANDSPLVIDGVTYTPSGGFNSQNINLLLGREWGSFDFKIEAGFLTGDVGTKTSTGEGLELNSYGFVTQMNYQPDASKTKWSLNAGMASGDNPETDEVLEGYFFDRNYDVAFLLFNHRMGGGDFFRTSMTRNNKAPVDAKNAYDDESVSNVTFLAPRITWAYSDKLDIQNTLTYAQLVQDPFVDAGGKKTGTAKDLGFEWDLEFIYKPRETVKWVTQFGVLSPGSAFEGGNRDYDKKSTFGFATKAAISF